MKEFEFNPKDTKQCMERAAALKALHADEDIQRMNHDTGEWKDLVIVSKSGFSPSLRYCQKLKSTNAHEG